MMVMSLKILSSSPRETVLVASALGRNLEGGEVIALFGRFGAGKTTFLKGLARSLGIRKKIKSPSFTILQAYDIKKGRAKKFYHFDLYRLKAARELEELGFAETLSDRGGIVAIEWPGRVKKFLPKKTIVINLAFTRKPNERIIELESM